jgi:beta-glucosidase
MMLSLRRKWIRSLATATATAVATASAALLVPNAQATQAATSQCSWMDTSKSADERASELIAAMTLDQKIAELYGRGEAGAYGGADEIPAVPALCIPELIFNDAGAGVGDAQTNTTAFPDGIAQAASWDPTMQQRLGAALGWEAWHKGVAVQLAPGVNIARNPLNGRNFEYAGEDPHLAAQTGAAIIKGIQSQNVVATVKHYALNDQETNRSTDSSDADERTMQEIHLPAFEAAVKAGVGSVMCSYNRVNSVYACENPTLLNTYLKQQFGFPGWVMSDWGATHSTTPAANAGLDQEMNVTQGTYFSDALKTAVENGQVPMSRLDDMVHRLMRSLFAVGVFDNPPVPEPAGAAGIVNTPAEAAIARQTAEAGTVLLKNTDNVLPLTGVGRKIAVIGDPAGPAGAQNAYQGGGSSKVPMAGANPNVVTPLQGITTRGEANGDIVTYTSGDVIADATAAASTADAAIVFAADAASEGVDRSTLSLTNGTCVAFTSCTASPTSPDSLISAVAAANPNTIVVLQTGGPVTMPWLDQVKGVVETWYPGQEDGNAAAAVLFGDVDPSGKLPVTFPKSLTDSPIQTSAQYPGVTQYNDTVGPHSIYSEGLLVGYRWYDAKGIQPLFPFGYGLSYTTFAYSGLSVKPTSTGATVSFTVTNTGSRTGAEVAQVYLGPPTAAGEPPKQLEGYQKVTLEPGASTRVTIPLDTRAFQQWNSSTHAWTTTHGAYTVMVGGSSATLPLRASIQK